MRTRISFRAAMIVLALSMLASLTTGMALPPDAEASNGLPALQEETSVAGVDVDVAPLPDTKVTNAPVVEPEWPASGVADVALPAVAAGAASAATKMAPVGDLPVAVGRAAAVDPAEKSAARQPGRVKVELLDTKTAEAAGVRGVLLRVSPRDGDTKGPLTVQLGYGGFASAYGGDYGARLSFVAMPECALSTPDHPECLQPTSIPSENATGDEQVAGEFRFDGNKPVLLAVLAEPAGGSGNFKATSLAPPGTWSAGGSSGDFTYEYPLRLPPTLGGTAPTFGLGYSSGSVDGRTVSTNNQSSWVGDGWDVGAGFIERRYKACTDDGQTNVGDLCWGTDNATLSLNGSTSEIIRNPATGYWHPKKDDGSRIERLTGAPNGDDNGEHWRVTTSNGTQYVFGMYRLPGWVSGKEETRSVWTVPVFGNNADEPCNKPAGFDASVCQQAYRWNLDYVVDPNGNATTYYYQREGNYYSRNASTAKPSLYIRGGWLWKVHYGLRADNVFANPPAAVTFDVTERCIPTSAFQCYANTLNAVNAAHWPDVPFDQICNAGETCTGRYSPTFFTRKRLSQVTTSVWTGTVQKNVDSWKFTQSYPPTGDGLAPSLWLDSIVHTGLVGGSKELPATTFERLARPNRVDTVDNRPPITRNRVVGVVNESGGYVFVRYSDPDCIAGSRMPANPHTNTMRCFPQWWVPEGGFEPILDYFHKYVVTDVTVDSRTGGTANPDGSGVAGNHLMKTHYDYLDGGAWHYDENDLIPEDKRTWNQWRGYGKVRVTTGMGTPQPSVSETRYLRGMDGDKQPGGVRDVWVTDETDNNARIEDHSVLAGHAWVSLTYDGATLSSVSKAEPWISAPTAINGEERAFLSEIASTKARTLLTGNTWRRTEVKVSYNGNGLPFRAEDLGDLAVTGDETCVTTEYARNDAAGIISFPKSVQTIFGTCATTPGLGINTILVHSSYDGAAWGVAPTKGNVTKVDELSRWVSGEQNWVTTSRTAYDAYGRVVETIDAHDNKITTGYTPVSGAQPSKVVATAPLEHVSTANLEPAWGLPTSTVAPSGATTHLKYDPLGRLISGWNPGHTPGGQQPDVTFDYRVSRDAASAVITTSRLDNNDGTLTSYALYDGLGRERQTQTPAPGAAGGRVITDTLHDGRGLQYQVNHAYWNNEQPSTALFGVSDNNVPGQTITTFDRLQRPTREGFRGLGVPKWATTYSHEGDRVHTQPPLGGTATTTIKDIRGQVTEIRQYHAPTVGGTFDSTKYTYSRIENLASITDTAGNVWRYGYDLQGQTISADDPDRGHTDLTYNALGQLTSTTDALGQTVAFSYDELGRKTGMFRDSVDGTQLAGWTFDSVKKGLQSAATRFVGEAEYTQRVVAYNAADQPTIAETVIPDTETGLDDTYRYTTDYMATTGKVRSVEIPAAGGLPLESVVQLYNNKGLPYAVLGTSNSYQDYYASHTDYSPYAEPLRVTNAHVDSPKNVDRTFFYDETTRRPTQTITNRETPTGYQVANDRTYTYDQVGNITRVTDAAQGASADTQCFTYDYLRQLSQAWTPASSNCATAPAANALGGAAPYWTSWTFDNIGNRRTQTDHTTGATTTYTYPAAGQPRPHAVQTITAPDRVDQYGYDPVGNTTTRTLGDDTQTLDYDLEGRLAEVTEANGDTSNYLYDADGNRLIKREPDVTTLYLPGMELRRDATTGTVTATRYYTHNGASVATRTNNGVTWTLPDQHGTVTTTINANTMAANRRYRDPYGNDRGPEPTGWTNPRGYLNAPEDTTGLTHLGARQYDPITGRFQTVDPILDPTKPQHLNAYTYAYNNPTTHSDPSGLIPPECMTDVSCPGHIPNVGCKGGCGTKANNAGKKPKPWSPEGQELGETQAKLYSKVKGRKLTDHELLEIELLGYEGSANYTYLELIEWAATQKEGFTELCMVTEQGDFFACAAMANEAFPEKSLGETFHEILDLAGFIPGIGEAADLLNGLIYLAEGDFQNALISAVAMAPGIGDAGKAGRLLCSFTGDTQVLMADGTTKPISNIERGDLVAAANPEVGERLSAVVTDIWSHEDSVVDVRLDNGAKIVTTEDHPYWNVTDQSWQRADQVSSGDRFFSASGSTVGFVGIVGDSQREMIAYNITVAESRTYFVVAGAGSILVHNDCRIGDAIARADLSGAQLANLKRYNKKLPAGAEETVITRASGGAVQFSTKVPGRVPGSYATYTKVVDTSGVTIGYTKTTVAPDGTIVHVKDKLGP